MGALRIYLFGGVRIEHSDRQLEIKPTHTTQSLLAYLILQRYRSHPRDVLAGLFWGDYEQERARSCLNTALWRLRSILEPKGVPSGTYLLGNHSGEIGFNQDSAYWLDAAVLEEKASHILPQPYQQASPDKIQSLENALMLYAGDLLEGFYDDWALAERERFRSLYLNCLSYLMRYQKHHGYYEEALTFGQQILSLDPLREEIHREVMLLYAANGQRTLAVRQYAICCQTLTSELQVQPMQETQEVLHQILDGNRRNEAALKTSATSQDLLQQLQMANELLEQVHGQLKGAICMLEEARIRSDPYRPPKG